jgi:hypothetical protein
MKTTVHVLVEVTTASRLTRVDMRHIARGVASCDYDGMLDDGLIIKSWPKILAVYPAVQRRRP